MSHKLNNIVKLGKDKSEKWMETSIVYKFQCGSCPATYIGQTKRNLKKRIDEHKKTPLEKLLPIPKHLKDNLSHNFDFEKVQIVDRKTNKYKRLISEMIYINTHSQTINRQEDTQFLSKKYQRIYRFLTSS